MNTSARPLRSHSPRLKPLVAALAIALSGQVLANPNGATVVSGNVSMASGGNTLTVTNSPGAIINWQNFSIGANEVTRFVQQSAASTVLNRVTGTDPSSILGSLQSNGHVWLINPNGIIFGQGARIDVAGLVASSLNISNQDFSSGLYKFSGSGAEGAVKNAGNINANGGPVLLFAPSVENSGIITSPNGEIILAAGHSVELADPSSPALRVTVTAGGEAVNLGQIMSQGGSISMVGGLVKQAGRISASSAVSEGGRIYLRADNAVSLEANSVTEANGAKGGQIRVDADSLIQSGALSASGSAGAGGSVEANGRFAGLSGTTNVSGTQGGTITVNAESTILTGNLSAAGSTGAGGNVKLNSASGLQQTRNSVIDVSSQKATGGTLRLSTSLNGAQYLSGSLKADGASGGEIILEGGDLTLAGARITATGASQGGHIYAGGGAHGADASISNVQTLKANASTLLDASANAKGNGGEVIVWADTQTAFVGSIAATGGRFGGNGGFVEVSSGGSLGYGGTIDVTAPRGQAGSVLFDPYDISIEALVSSGFSTVELADPAPNPADGHGSGGVEVLPNGNIVVASPNDSDVAANAGAVYLYRPDGTLVSLLYGTQAYDQVGSGVNCVECWGVPGITVLSGGNFVINSPNWASQAGAVTWGSADSGVNGPVSAGNSLVGSTAYDGVGGNGIEVLGNGNYLVLSPNWYNPVADAGMAGAVTFGSGTSGVRGAVSESNSLVGGNSSDSVGSNGVTELANGNYVVISPWWNSGRGAATWGDGNTGISGLVSEANSLVGGTAGDYVGEFGVHALANGNYVVISPDWYNPVTMATGAGAVTWGDGNSGTGGLVSEANSLVGSTAYDNVGNYCVTELANGNYVVISPWWDNGAVIDAGAVTWVNGSTGTSGLVSAANSLVGASASDLVGGYGVTALANGNYVVNSPSWDNGLAVDAGAVTWGDGTTGAVGVVSISNSLVGSTTYDNVGQGGVYALGNGNYVVDSMYWDNGGISQAGAVTWGNGNGGTVGVVSSANSLVGNTTDDMVGAYGITVLSNSNYLVLSPYWDNGIIINAGAVTWGNGGTGSSGVVSASNSLVGGTDYDSVGLRSVIELANGNYVVANPYWDNGAAVDAGAVTWGNGSTGTSGVVSTSNSLTGGTAYDYVGMYGVSTLANGNYVVASPNWDNPGVDLVLSSDDLVNAGAASWVNGATGQLADGSYGGAIASANSLVGAYASDVVGLQIVALDNGNYVVNSLMWNNCKGAVTWGNGATGVVGEVSALNSLIGSTVGDYVGNGNFLELANGNYVLQSRTWGGGKGAVTWVNGATGQLADGSFAGEVSEFNSLIGASQGDYIGNNGVMELASGNYLALNPGNTTTVTSGSISFGDGSAGTVGVVSGANSLMLTNGIPPQSPIVVRPYRGDSFVFWQAEGDAWSAIGGQVFLAQWGSGMGSVAGSVFGNDTALNYRLDPSAITALLDSGADVTLQAHHDINVNADIYTTPGIPVALNLQAYNDINLNADIVSGGAALSLNLLPDADLNGAGAVNVLGVDVPRVLGMAGGTVTIDGMLNVEHSLDGGGSGRLDVLKGYSQATGADVSGFDSISITQESGDLVVGNLSTVAPAGGFSNTSPLGIIALQANTNGISQQSGTTLTSAAVLAEAPNGVIDLSEANTVDYVAGASGSNFFFTSTHGFSVTGYDDGVIVLDGINAGVELDLASQGGGITINNAVTAGSNVALYAAGDINLNAGLDVAMTAPTTVELKALGDINLGADIHVTGASLANLILRPDMDGIGGNQVNIQGSGPARVLDVGNGLVQVLGRLNVANSLSGNGGSLRVDEGFTQAGGTTVSGFDSLSIHQAIGDLNVGNLSVNVPGNGYDPLSRLGVIWLDAQSGSITQQSGTTLTAAAVGAQASGSVTLTGNNPVGVVFGSAGGDFSFVSISPILVTYYDDEFYQDGIQAGNDLWLGSYGEVVLDAQASAGGSMYIGSYAAVTVNAALDAGKNIAIGATGSVTLNGQVGSSTGDIAVAAGSDFVNNAGASALSTPNGRWLVYAADPATSSFGSLDSGNHAIWGQTGSSYDPANVTETGNRYIFAWQPTVTFTGDTFSKTYGDDLTVSIVSAYSVSGLHPGVTGAFLADAAADAYTGTPDVTSSGAAANAAVNGGASYAVSVSPGTVSALNGYLLAFADGSFTIDKANATVTANSATVTYNGLQQSVTGFTASGLVNGETESVLTGVSQSGGSGKNAGSYLHSVSGADGNYNLTFVDGALTIDKATLTIAAVSDTRMFDGSTASSLTPLVSGLQGSDTMTNLSQVFDSHYVGNRILSVAGGYSLNDGNGGNNYSITTTTANGSILVDPSNFVWANSAGGAWENATNWNQGVTPVNGSQVTLTATSGGVTFNSTAAIKSITSASDLTLQGGSFTLGSGLKDTSSFSGGAGLFVDAGSLILNGANLSSNVTMKGGSLKGYGSLNGNLLALGGVVSPGFSPAALTINGDLTLGPNSTLVMELGDPLNPAANDQINVSGLFAKDGALQLAAINGYAPLEGDSFTLFTFGSESGAFAGMALPGQNVSLSGGVLQILAQTLNTGEQIVQVLESSTTQVSTESGLLFTVTDDEEGDNNENDNASGMVCTG